jgi:hypothetical protein
MMAGHFVDIVENGLDLLIRIGNRLDSSMISHRSGFYPAKIVCFIEFLAAEFKLDPWVSDYGV